MAIALTKGSNLLGRLVLNQQTAEVVGRIRRLFVDTTFQQMSGIRCTSGTLGHTTRDVKWDDIMSIGDDSVLIDWNPEEPLKASEAKQGMIGLELWVDSASEIGIVKDYCLNLKTGTVTDYLFVSQRGQGLKDGAYRLPPDAIIAVGPQRILANYEAIQLAEQFSAGLPAKHTGNLDCSAANYTRTEADATFLVEDAPKKTAVRLQHSLQRVAT
ncbi:MAG: hypothetical protein AAFX01_02840 [Cyanobacteria bacterium J06638_28]